MKAFFFPYYFYLQYEPFRRTMEQLRARGADAFLVPMHAAWLDERQAYGAERFARDQCPVKELPLVRTGLAGEGMVQRVSRFPRFFVNRARIYRFLKREKPNVVVLGSDLGGVYIRVVQDCCRLLKIPVVVLATVDVVEDSNTVRGISVAPFVRSTLRTLKIERTLTFNHWALGSYLDDSVIAVSGPAMKERLVAAGIASPRIRVTGNPAHDRFYGLRREPRDNVRRSLASIFSGCMTDPVVTYCSETIQEVYGWEYLARVNEVIRRAVAAAADEWQLVVKLHPREPRRAAAIFEESFHADRCRVVRDVDLYQLVRASDVVIAHFSHVLKEAILIGTPVLVVHLTDDPLRRTLMPPVEAVIAHSDSEVAQKLHMLLFDRARSRIVMDELERWLAGFALQPDGGAAARVADLILAAAERTMARSN